MPEACWPLLEAHNLFKSITNNLFQKVRVLLKKLNRQRPAGHYRRHTTCQKNTKKTTFVQKVHVLFSTFQEIELLEACWPLPEAQHLYKVTTALSQKLHVPYPPQACWPLPEVQHLYENTTTLSQKVHAVMHFSSKWPSRGLVTTARGTTLA